MKKVLKKGDFVCLQGEKAECFYFLINGKLEVKFAPNVHEKVNIVDAFAGKTVNFISQPGMLFGEIATILNSTRQASVFALEDSEVMLIPIRDHESYKVALSADLRLGFNLGASISSHGQGLKKVLKSISLAEREISEEGKNFKKSYQELVGYVKSIPRIGKRQIWYKEITQALSRSPFLLPSAPQSKKKASFFPSGKTKFVEYLQKNKIAAENYYPGAFLFHKNKIEESIYVLLKGNLELRVNGVVTDQISENGTVFGEDEMFLNFAARDTAKEQPSDVVCTTISSLIKLSYSEFKDIFSNSSEFVYEFIFLMAQRLVARNLVVFEAEKQLISLFHENIDNAFTSFDDIRQITQKAENYDPELGFVLNLAGQRAKEATERQDVWRNWLVSHDIFLESSMRETALAAKR